MSKASWRKTYLLAAAVLLLSGAVVGLLWAFLRVPAQREREISRLNYSVKAEFIHQAYASVPLERAQANPIYFTRTIDSVEASFTYQFLSEKLTSSVTEDIEIRAVVSSTGLWEKEVVLVPTSRKEGDFTVTFPLDTASLFQLAKDIAAELDAGAPAPEIVLKARVSTVADTERGQIKEEFIQSARLKVGAATVELVRPLSHSRRGYFQGVAYEQKGGFNYAVRVKSGTLYSNLSSQDVNQRSYLPPSPQPKKPLPNPVYFSKAIDFIEASYGYSFLAETSGVRAEEEVEIRAVVGSPGSWEKEVVLIPPVRKQGDFTVAFRLDIDSLQRFARDISTELGVAAPAPEITLRATVRATLQTEKGPILEEFVQSARVKVGAGTVEFVRPLSQRAKGQGQGLKHEQRGSFGYAIHTRPGAIYEALSMDDVTQRSYLSSTGEKDLPGLIYFTKIIDSVDASFSHSFRSNKVTRVEEDVEVLALVGSPGLWTKEVVLVPTTRREGDFTVTFPLDVHGLLRLGKDIATELGVGAPAPEVTLKGVVRSTAQTANGTVKKEFIQIAKIKVGEMTLEWVRPLNHEDRGEVRGITYEERGAFGYAIRLKENKLFGSTVLGPGTETQTQSLNGVAGRARPPAPLVLHPAPEPAPLPWWENISVPLRTLTPDGDLKPAPVPLKAGASYPTDGLHSLDLTFTYDMISDKSLSAEAHEVSVTAFLPVNGWPAQGLPLVPKQVRKEKFAIAFPLDIGLLIAAIDASERNLPSAAQSSYSLLIKAQVKGSAQSAYGPVSDVLQQDLIIKLDRKSIQWPDARPITKSGAIKEKVRVPNEGARWARQGSLGGMGLVVLGLAYGAWSYRRGGLVGGIRPGTDDRRSRAKHKDIIVDVRSLPPLVADERVVRIASLEELTKTADALLKPVLHETGAAADMYCVSDGNTRYVYESQSSDRP